VDEFGYQRLDRVREGQWEWLWQDRVPIGAITLIAGLSNVGKSPLLGDLVTRVTRAEKFPGDARKQKPRTVLYHCVEESHKKTIRPRLRQFGADMRRVHIDPLGNVKLDPARLAAAIKKYKATVLVFDPLEAYLKHQYGVRLREELQQLSQVCDEYEATIIGIAHFNKTGKTFIDLLKGGSQYYQVTRMILGVFKVDYANAASPLVLTRAKCSPQSLDPTSVCYSLPKGNGTNNYLRPIWLREQDTPETMRRGILTLGDLVKAAVKHGAGAGGVIETQGGRAERLVKEVLADAGGTLPAAVLDAALVKHSVAPKQIELAKTNLRRADEIKPNKTKKGWEWSLVNPPDEEAEPDGVSTKPNGKLPAALDALAAAAKPGPTLAAELAAVGAARRTLQ